jgi:hypothetical protein
MAFSFCAAIDPAISWNEWVARTRDREKNERGMWLPDGNSVRGAYGSRLDLLTLIFAAALCFAFL